MLCGAWWVAPCPRRRLTGRGASPLRAPAALPCRFNNGRFYLLVDGDEPIVSARPPGLLLPCRCLPARPLLTLCAPAPACTARWHCPTLWRAPCVCAQEPWKLTRNQELNIMHVHNASEFVASARHAVVPGDTLVFDFVFFLHPVGGWVWVWGRLSRGG